MEKNFEEISESEEEFILSLCWDSGDIAAVYFNLSTLELNIIQEVNDHRPDFNQLRSIFRQVQPSYLVASGPNSFLKELLELLDPASTENVENNISKYMVKKNKTSNANASNMTFFPFNRKQLDEPLKVIYNLDLPGLPPDTSKSDREIFMNSAIPISQELVVISLGNLLRYLIDNHLKWSHVFLTLEKNPIITNVIVKILDSQVLLDEMTFNSLNIFSNIYHPSSFKIQVRKDGLSLFNLLNHCSSSIGTQELKSILKQPICDLNELNLRFETTEWLMKIEHADHVLKFKHYLSGFVNVNAVFQRIIRNHGHTNDWRSLKRTVYNVFSICEICASFSEESVNGTLLQELASYYKDGLSINGILFALDKIVDLEAIDEKKRFIVKKGLDEVLDQKREILADIFENFNNLEPDEVLETLNDAPNAFQFVFYPEMGFVVGTTLKVDQLNLSLMAESNVELLLRTNDAVYFKTPNCNALNQDYDEKLTGIIAHEMKIFNKLIQYINENFADLAETTKLCAKLDCLISFASVAAKYNFVKPIITEDRVIKIINGRHPLVEQIKDYVSNSTDINQENKHFINIIRAPNSSGKSVYVKQIALICYMAHIGCFVSAESATITLLHSIYTRIYTPESIYHNQSAFMSDLQQMSKVVMNSTSRSLILIDEFGKGTHYKDGIALLTATIEHFIQRGNELCPFVFITTHYPQVYQLLQTKELTNLKTIITKKNSANIFQSTFKVTDGCNDQVCTEYPESQKIIANIFNQKERDIELEKFNEGYNTSVRAFVLVMTKMMLRKDVVTDEFIKEIYTKVDIENFLA